jgi:Lar family restriction alleviation protein
MPEAKNEPPWTSAALNVAADVRLRNCPFCGSRDASLYEYTYAKLFTVKCNRCGAEGPRNSLCRQAQGLWNSRKPTVEN